MSPQALTPDRLLVMRGSLIRREPGGPDEYGDPRPPVETVVADVPCLLQMQSSDERAEASVQSSRWRLFLPELVGALRGWDAIEVAGSTYELAGDAWPVLNPRTGAVSHLEAYAVRVE